jgi:hypothetical protein
MAELTVNEKINSAGQPIKYGASLVIEMEKLTSTSTASLYVREGNLNGNSFLSQRGYGAEGKGDISRIDIKGNIDVNKSLFSKIKNYAQKANAVVSLTEQSKISNPISL